MWSLSFIQPSDDLVHFTVEEPHWEARIPWGWQSESTEDRLHTCMGSGAAGQHTIEQCSVQQGLRVPSLSVCRHYGGCSSLHTSISLYGVWEGYSDHEGLGHHWLKPISLLFHMCYLQPAHLEAGTLHWPLFSLRRLPWSTLMHCWWHMNTQDILGVDWDEHAEGNMEKTQKNLAGAA